MTKTKSPPPPNPAELTESQRALAQYFYTVSADPWVKAAGRDVVKFAKSFAGRIWQDVPTVTVFLLRGAVALSEAPVRAGTKGFTAFALAGSVPPKLAEAIAETVDEEFVGRGFRWLGEKLAGANKGQKR